MDGTDVRPARQRRDPRSDGSRPWWTAAVTAAVVCLVPVAAGCGAGQIAQTSEQVTNSTGAVAQVGEISVLGVEFLFDRPVAGDEVYGIGQTAPLAITLVNSGDHADRLVRVSSPIAEAGIVVADGVVIPGGQTLTAGQTGPVSSIEVNYEDDAALIALTGLRVPIRSGLNYPVVFGFERAGDVLIEVPVDTPGFPRPPAVATE